MERDEQGRGGKHTGTVAETPEQAGVQQARGLTNSRANRTTQDSPEKGQWELNQGGASRTAREVKDDQEIRQEESWKQSCQRQMVKSRPGQERVLRQKRCDGKSEFKEKSFLMPRRKNIGKTEEKNPNF